MAINLTGNVSLPTMVTAPYNAGGYMQNPATSGYGTYRGPFSDWFNSEAIAYEDYMRNEQSKAKDFERDLYLKELEMDYNRTEAEKNRQYQTWMSNTAYSRAMQDIRNAGLNPLLAYSQGGASTPTGSQASISAGGFSSSGNTAGAGYGAKTSDFFKTFGSLMKVVTGAYFLGGSSSKPSKTHFGFGRQLRD